MENDKGVSLRDYVDVHVAATKEHFEARINNLEKHLGQIEEQKEAARRLALVDVERRLEAMNESIQRATDLLNTYLPRETWDKYREDDIIWKRQAEVLRPSWVTQAEFIAYKETTQTALDLSAGKRQGISSLMAAVVVFFSIASAISTVASFAMVFFKH